MRQVILGCLFDCDEVLQVNDGLSHRCIESASSILKKESLQIIMGVVFMLVTFMSTADVYRMIGFICFFELNH